MTNIPLITWFQRQWLLIVLFFITNWLCLTEIHFSFLGKWVVDPQLGGIWRPATPLEFCGPLLWAIPYGIAAYLLALLSIHLHYRQTLDADTHNETYLNDWRACTSSQRVYVAAAIRIGIFIGFCILLSNLAKAAVPNVDQDSRWQAATVNPKARIALDVAVAQYQRNEWRYQQIANMRPGTVPPQVLFCLHMRESDCNFKCSPAQGDSLQHRSIHVPKGRIPDKEPPYTFEQAAIDSYFNVDRLDLQNWKTTKGTLDAITAFNGWGPEYRGYPSGYTWAGTSVYRGGKFVADGHWSPITWDQQLGCAAILKAMQAKGIEVSPLPWPRAVK